MAKKQFRNIEKYAEEFRICEAQKLLKNKVREDLNGQRWNHQNSITVIYINKARDEKRQELDQVSPPLSVNKEDDDLVQRSLTGHRVKTNIQD